MSCELVGGAEGGYEGEGVEGVEDEVEGGLLALLGDAIGYELEGGDLVVAAGEDVEG